MDEDELDGDPRAIGAAQLHGGRSDLVDRAVAAVVVRRGVAAFARFAFVVSRLGRVRPEERFAHAGVRAAKLGA